MNRHEEDDDDFESEPSELARTNPLAAARIDQRSERLLQEYKEHRDTIAAKLARNGIELEEPGLHEAMMFTAWSTQKIAGLQILAEEQAGVIGELIRRIELLEKRRRRT